MKLNIKTIIIVFLVALLGSGLGTFGVMSYFNSNNDNSNNNNVVINEVEYTNLEKTDYTQVVEKTYNTVVEITCKSVVQTPSYFFFSGGTQETTSAGSGVIISSDGYIVTNAHVIEGISDESSIQIKLYNGETVGAKIIGYDTRTDLAVLKIDANNLPYASFADSANLTLGQDVIAIGNPLGLGKSVSNGIISALEKEIYVNKVYMTVIQTNAAVNAGNSGGGLFDTSGNLVGVVNAKKMSSYTESVEGMGYAIPSNTVLRIVNDLIQNGYVKDRAVLGVKVITATTGVDGVIVSEVVEGSGAAKAGIEAEDVIISLDDTKVSSYADLSKVLDSKTVGETVNVTVLRNETEYVFNVTLQAASDQ